MSEVSHALAFFLGAFLQCILYGERLVLSPGRLGFSADGEPVG